MAHSTWGQWVGGPGGAYTGQDAAAYAAAPTMAYAQPVYPAAAAGLSPRYSYQAVAPMFAAQPPAAAAAAPYGSGRVGPAAEYDCEVRSECASPRSFIPWWFSFLSAAGSAVVCSCRNLSCTRLALCIS
jgi:hypothetical protein